MKRAILALGLVGLLSAGLLSAAEVAPVGATDAPVGLCAASASNGPQLPGVPSPLLLQVACSATATCPDGS